MSPSEYIAEIERLLLEEKEQEALAFSERESRNLVPDLTPEQDVYVGRLLDRARYVVFLTAESRKESAA